MKSGKNESKKNSSNNKEGPYIRDGRCPFPSSIAISRVMSANKGRDTGPELRLRRALWMSGRRGYRTNIKRLPGSPDIVFSRKRLAIFVHGCFWHRCPKCKPSSPKSNPDFWMKKFERNEERDARKLEELNSLGWRTIVVWECEIRSNLGIVVSRIDRAMEEQDVR